MPGSSSNGPEARGPSAPWAARPGTSGRPPFAHFGRRSLRQTLPSCSTTTTLAPLGLVQVGRAEQHRQSLVVDQLPDDLPQVPPRQRIDANRRLIQQQQFRQPNQRAGQPQLLLHPARQPAGQAVGERSQRRHLHQPRVAFPPLRGGDTVHVGIEVQVLQNAQVLVQPEPLRHVADAFLDLLGVGGHIDIQDLQLARVGRHQPRRQPNERRLARTIGPNQGREHPRTDLQGDGIERLDHFAGVAAECLADVAAHQDRRVSSGGAHRGPSRA